MDTEGGTDWAERGQLARAARKRRNWTQKDLADAVDVSPRTVTTLENGRAISKANWVAIARSLGLTASETKATPEEALEALRSLDRQGEPLSEGFAKALSGKVDLPALLSSLVANDDGSLRNAQIIEAIGILTAALARRESLGSYALAADDERPRAADEPTYDDGGV